MIVLRSKAAIQKYRRTFNGSDGRWTLAELLKNSGLLQTISSEEQRIAHNQAVALLENLGATQGKNYRRIVDTILATEIPPQAVTVSDTPQRAGTRRLLGRMKE
jgi:hypothetical protein